MQEIFIVAFKISTCPASQTTRQGGRTCPLDVIAGWVVTCMTCNRSVMISYPMKGSRCFLEQETLPSLLSSSWFQERIQLLVHNQTKIN